MSYIPYGFPIKNDWYLWRSHITSQLRQARSSTMENLAKAKSFAESVSSGCSKDVNWRMVVECWQKTNRNGDTRKRIGNK